MLIISFFEIIKDEKTEAEKLDTEKLLLKNESQKMNQETWVSIHE